MEKKGEVCKSLNLVFDLSSRMPDFKSFGRMEDDEDEKEGKRRCLSKSIKHIRSRFCLISRNNTKV